MYSAVAVAPEGGRKLVQPVPRGPGGRQRSSLLDFELVKLQTEAGERFPVLISLDGLPLRMPLRYSFDQRSRGGAARIEKRLRRIGELYQWCAENDCDLDSLLLGSNRLPIPHIARALQELGSPIADERDPQAAPILISANQTNQRITAWLEFLGFAAIPHNWRSGDTLETSEEVLSRRIYVQELTDFLSLRRLSEPPPSSHEPLTEDELEAIYDVLFGPEHLSPFLKRCRWRNGLIFRLVRFGALRIGEALKEKSEDLPPVLGSGSSAISGLIGKAQGVRVVRRPDDPSDNRLREARVKRGDRFVELPDDLIHALQVYARKRGCGASASDYLFVSSRNPAMALSQSRAEKIILQIGRAAGRRFNELFPGVTHSLDKLCWHRLRTTRAIELLPEYFPDGEETEIGTRDFVEFFGWAAMTSARPYLKKLRERKSNDAKSAMRREIRESNLV